VTVISPAQATRIGATGDFLAQWNATDPDGDLQDVMLEYSADDGKTYRPIYLGGKSNKVSLPVSFLTKSEQARLRIVVSDGFNQDSAVSAKFKVDGAAPIVEIQEPVDKMQIRTGVLLKLVGRAVDNSRKLIPDDHLKWFSDKSSIGSGSQVDVDGLRAGRHEIRLEATDANAKVGVAKVVITVIGDKGAGIRFKWWMFLLLLLLLILIIWVIVRWKAKHP
jgi:hypothetical protein